MLQSVNYPILESNSHYVSSPCKNAVLYVGIPDDMNTNGTFGDKFVYVEDENINHIQT